VEIPVQNINEIRIVVKEIKHADTTFSLCIHFLCASEINSRRNICENSLDWEGKVKGVSNNTELIFSTQQAQFYRFHKMK